jgi:hypothetical protein
MAPVQCIRSVQEQIGVKLTIKKLVKAGFAANISLDNRSF